MKSTEKKVKTNTAILTFIRYFRIFFLRNPLCLSALIFQVPNNIVQSTRRSDLRKKKSENFDTLNLIPHLFPHPLRKMLDFGLWLTWAWAQFTVRHRLGLTSRRLRLNWRLDLAGRSLRLSWRGTWWAHLIQPPDLTYILICLTQRLTLVSSDIHFYTTKDTSDDLTFDLWP